MAKVVEKSPAIACTASLCQLLGVLLKLGHFGVLRLWKTKLGSIDIIFLESTTETLISPTADTEDWQSSGDLIIVTEVLIWVEGFLVLLNGIFLVKSTYVD